MTPSSSQPSVSFSPADSTIAAQVARYAVHDYRYPDGQQIDVFSCGAEYCWDRITVDAYDSGNRLIAQGYTCALGCLDGLTYASLRPRLPAAATKTPSPDDAATRKIRKDHTERVPR